ncbi:MAG: hypothetical protein R6U58_10355, partial [Bacteroidales bacterium]
LEREKKKKLKELPEQEKIKKAGKVKYLLRLRDAIDRKNIYGIEEALIRFSEIDRVKNNGGGETGYFKHVLPKYLKTKRYLKKIQGSFYCSIALFISTIILSLIFIVITDSSYSNNYYRVIILFSISCLFFIIGFIKTIYLLWFSLSQNIGMEQYKIKICQDLRNKYQKINNLYTSLKM